MSAAEWVPIIGAVTALVGAAAAVWANRRKPVVDDATAAKIKSEIATDQIARDQERDAANIKRDRHIVRLENWGFQVVRPWSRRASMIVDEQNDLLVKLAARAKIEFTPKHLEPLAEMPQLDDGP